MEALPTHVSQIILGAAPWRNCSGVRIINRVCLEWSRASGSEEACGPLCQHFGTDITRRYSGQGTARDSFRSLFYEQQQMAQGERLDLHGRWIGHGEVEGCQYSLRLLLSSRGRTALWQGGPDEPHNDGTHLQLDVPFDQAQLDLLAQPMLDITQIDGLDNWRLGPQ